MYTAAICEDDSDIASYIRTTLISEFNKNNVSVSFDTFQNGNQLLDMIKDHYHFDIIFMDIEMPEIDGISVCKEIRLSTNDPLVIFISNKEELVFSTFEVQPFRFIRKSHFDALLSTLIPSIITELQRRNPTFIQITEHNSGDIFSFDINQIIYIEAHGKKCCIHQGNQLTEVKMKLMELEEQLTSYEFIKSHRSYLVNYKYIFAIKKNNLELSDGTLIPISRDRVDNVKHAFIQYMNRSI